MTEDVYLLGDGLLGPLSKRPSPLQEVRWYIDKDTGIAYVSNGTTWIQTGGSSLPGVTSDGANGIAVAGKVKLQPLGFLDGGLFLDGLIQAHSSTPNLFGVQAYNNAVDVDGGSRAIDAGSRGAVAVYAETDGGTPWGTTEPPSTALFADQGDSQDLGSDVQVPSLVAARTFGKNGFDSPAGIIVAQDSVVNNQTDFAPSPATGNLYEGRVGGFNGVNGVLAFRVNIAGGPGFYSHVAPAAQPTATVVTSTITDVNAKATIKSLIGIINGCGLAAITES